MDTVICDTSFVGAMVPRRKGKNGMNKAAKFIEALRAVELTTLGKYLHEEGKFERITVAPTVIVRDDGDIVLSGEAGDGAIDGNSYYIDPSIEAVAAKHGYEFEFESAGAAIAYPIR